MQKLDLTENIKQIEILLRSEEIVSLMSNLPVGQPIVQVRNLTPLIIESKSNFDKIETDSKKSKILQALNAHSLYTQDKIGDLINAIMTAALQNHHKFQFLAISNALDFYSFHKGLIAATNICEKVLFSNGLVSLQTDDTIIFRILSEGGLELSKSTKIFSLLRDLIEVIQRVIDEKNLETTITLFDSGSDTNLGLKTTVEVSKSLFQIFKEVWDWLLNRKFYKNKLRNSGIMDSLSVMTAIKEALDKGAINEETARIYRETIIIKTEDLLELNVVPKELYDLKPENNNRKLLTEFSEVKMIENSKDNKTD